MTSDYVRTSGWQSSVFCSLHWLDGCWRASHFLVWWYLPLSCKQQKPEGKGRKETAPRSALQIAMCFAVLYSATSQCAMSLYGDAISPCASLKWRSILSCASLCTQWILLFRRVLHWDAMKCMTYGVVLCHHVTAVKGFFVIRALLYLHRYVHAYTAWCYEIGSLPSLMHVTRG